MSRLNSRATWTMRLASDSRYCGSRNKRIRRRRHLMEEQPLLEIAQAERRLGADEVRLMTAQRQGLAQLGRHHPAASHRRVADDADVQGRAHSFRRCGRTRGCFTTMPSANATPAMRAELRVTALDELPEPDRRQTRGHGVGMRRLELRDVTGQRAALRLVVLADIHDERRRGHVVDEVVADRLGLPRVAIRLVPAKARTEHAFGEQMTCRNVVGMSIGPIRYGDDLRSGGSHETGDEALMVRRRSRSRGPAGAGSRARRHQAPRAPPPLRRGVLRRSRCCPSHPPSDRTARHDDRARHAWRRSRRCRSRCHQGAARWPAYQPEKCVIASSRTPRLPCPARREPHAPGSVRRETRRPACHPSCPAQTGVGDSCGAARCT